MDSYLPARYSMNTFFVRHVANPKRLKHIEGLNRAPICAVYDDGYFPSTTHKNTFPPNNFNEAVIKSNSESNLPRVPRKKEKLLPPQGQFMAYGILEDTDRWKDELGSLATSVGLLTQNDIEKAKKRKEREKYIQSLEQASQSKPSSSSGQQTPKKPSSSYSIKTSRLNEPLRTGRRTSRGSQASRGLSTGFQPKYVVDENEREVWMLQVLCQILQTDSLVDVQSWLVSSNPQEKDHVRTMIDSAMKGLEANGRIDNSTNMSRDFATPQYKHTSRAGASNEEHQQQQAVEQNGPANLDRIQTMIEKMNLKSANIKNDANRFSRHMSAVSNSGRQSLDKSGHHGTQNILRLPDIAEYMPELERKLANSQASLNALNTNNRVVESKPLDAIPENDATALKMTDNTEYKSPLSPVFNINIYPSAGKKQPLNASDNRNSQSNNNNELTENTVIKVEAPAKDFKIEELNVTMVVKDEKTHQLQKINGNWKPETSLPQAQEN